MLAGCVLLAIVIAYWGGQQLMQRAEAYLMQVEAEVADALLLESSSRPPVQADRIVADFNEWSKDVTLLELNMDIALVNVIVSHPNEIWYDQPYRVGRILRQSADGWQSIDPTNIFWNRQRTLETAYFRLDYGPRDEGAVKEAISAFEEAYLRLHTDLALPSPAAGDVMNIKIALIEGSTVRATDLTYSGETLFIPPPDMIPRPLDMSNAEALRQAITYALAVKLFTKEQELFPTPCTWSAIAEGIGLWLRWEGHTLPSRRRWVYEDTLREQGKVESLPRLNELLSFPLSCSRPPSILEAEILNSGRPIPRQELASTLIEYIVATNGRQIIPQLLHDLDISTDWDDLAHSALGISAEELETGWQGYLSEREQ